MNIYSPFRPKLKKGNKLMGHGQGMVDKIVKNASSLINSPNGKKLMSTTKSQILNSGANIVDSVLSGTSPKIALKKATSSLRKKLTTSAKRKIKAKILGRKNRKLKGGALLYKLPTLYKLRGFKLHSKQKTGKKHKKTGKKHKSQKRRKRKKSIKKRVKFKTNKRKRKSKSRKKSKKGKFHISNFFLKKRKRSTRSILKKKSRRSPLRTVFDV